MLFSPFRIANRRKTAAGTRRIPLRHIESTCGLTALGRLARMCSKNPRCTIMAPTTGRTASMAVSYTHLAPSEKPPEIIIKLIGPSGAVTGTLRFDEGRQQWLPSEIDSTDEAPICLLYTSRRPGKSPPGNRFEVRRNQAAQQESTEGQLFGNRNRNHCAENPKREPSYAG